MKYLEAVKKLQKREVFHFARVGDGEMLCMADSKGQNCDGHKYYPELGKALRKIYNEKRPYYVGLQPIKHGLFTNHEKYPQDWCNADIFHEASLEGKLQPFMKALMNRNVVMIGNRKHSKLAFVNIMIEVPTNNAWTKRLEVWESIKQVVQSEYQKGLVLLFSCGMSSGVYIDALAKSKAGKYVTTIDTGSVFDPYIGRNTRSYHKKVIEIIEKDSSWNSYLRKEKGIPTNSTK